MAENGCIRAHHSKALPPSLAVACRARHWHIPVRYTCAAQEVRMPRSAGCAGAAASCTSQEAPPPVIHHGQLRLAIDFGGKRKSPLCILSSVNGVSVPHFSLSDRHGRRECRNCRSKFLPCSENSRMELFRASLKWWRRWESNPRPQALYQLVLHA